MAVSVWPLAAFYLLLALRTKTEIHGTSKSRLRYVNWLWRWLVRGWPSICPIPLALRVLAGLTGI